MKFPYTYFEDEVRDGFYVPGMMKRAWAAQLEVLEDIRKVCEKHHITYYAEWGTLLGAVRHGGFIPWDDDMDICMKREDYNRFLSVAEKELPQGYQLMSFRNDDYWEMLTRVLNGKQIRFDEDYLEKFHGFPYVVGIDVFPMDYLAIDEEEERLRDDMVNFIASVAKMVESKENAEETVLVSDEEIEQKLCQVEELCNVRLDRNSQVKRQLYILMDQLFSLYSEAESEYITVMPLWLREGLYKLPKAYYQETVMLPFENIKVPAPAAYDAVLRASYGDYMKPVHSWDTHDYPFYKRQEAQLAQYGIKPDWYVFSADDLDKEGHAMKKKDKERAGEIIRLLEKAHSGLIKAIKAGDIDMALELLEKCQSGAISLGTMLEQGRSAGRCQAAVGILEEYCEYVYQVHEKLAQQIPVNSEQIHGSLKKRMEAVADSIQECMPERIEVVFLPYKASMWDSLESVWKAADKDPDCDAYVVPIPYYDKNIDGSFRELHYEGDQYPDDVPVTWYEDYDFAGRQPDMIFIHNPYDEYNHVTSVHPFFYAKNLKQFTDKLIYIPYFVLDEINPADKRAVMSMEHFVAVPGVIHADQVIVQSENMRRAYIDVLVRFAGEDTRGIWEKKILGLGSPKFDKVQSTGKEELEIPEEWRRVLEKPGGSWKKVVLYNTSVSALLEQNEKMLEKLKDVFSVFREKQDEVALLWRPHPLIEAAIGAMRPQLWEEYEKIKEKYQEEKWGIYDDSAKLDRAIALSDAYYGDASSVAILYQHMNKPVLIQSLEIVCSEQKKEDYLWAYDFAVDGDWIWFVPYWYNRLCRYNCREKRIDLLKQIPVINETEGLYVHVLKMDHYVILLPFGANEICIYNILEDEMRVVPIKNKGMLLNKFGISTVWNGQMYLFPFDYPAICKMDVQKGTVVSIMDLPHQSEFRQWFFQWDYHVEGSVVYLLSGHSNHIFRFDMADDTYEFIPVGESSECYSTIYFESESKIYLSDKNGDVVIYDHMNQTIEKIENKLPDFQIHYQIPCDVCFIDNIRFGNYIYYIPGKADRIVAFHTITKELQACHEDYFINDKKNQDIYATRFSVIHKTNEMLRGFNIDKRYFYEINVKTGEKQYHNIVLNQELLLASAAERMYEPFGNRSAWRHIESAALYSDLHALIHNIPKNKLECAEPAASGKKIYEFQKNK